MRRLDRVAGEVNPFLVIIAVGLALLSITRLAALGLSNLSVTRVDPKCIMSPASAAGGVGIVTPPN